MGQCRLFRLAPLLVIILLLSFPAFLYSQPVDNRTEEMIFKVAVYGPSDEVFIWWGHAALIVEYRWGYSRVFDWGIFSYPSDNFLLDFVKNKVQYKCTTGSLDMDTYIKEDRDITVYTLDLSTEGKEAMLKYAENKVLPENCYYDYHEFLDNCSTGVRDILDIGTGGQFRSRFSGTPGRLSRRQHVRRFSCLRPFPDWCFDFLMGRDLDRPISAWDEMFLPVEVGRNISDFRYTDNSGAERSLVKSVEIINSSKKRQPILNKPLTVWPFYLILGLILASILVLVKMQRGKSRRIIYGIIMSLMGLFFGTAGTVLFYGLYFMPNDYIQQNANIFFVNPLLFAAVPLGVIVASGKFRRLRAGKWLRLLWTWVFLAGVITVLAGLIPGLYQRNQSVQGIILPAAFVLADPGRWKRYIRFRLKGKYRE